MSPVKHTKSPNGEPSAAVFAEAAAWVARLHGPNRSQAVEKGFRRWLAADPTHAAAFESMTGAWEITGKLPAPPFPRLSRWQRAGYREGFIRSAVAMAAVGAVAIGVFFYFQAAGGVVTAVGEQRTLTLADGTRVFLNTATRMSVSYSGEMRRIDLQTGEALFEVAQRPNWPFVVKAGDRQINALGTAFLVRRDATQVAVTLVEGRVAISPAGLVAHAAGAEKQSPILTPGQRLTFAGRGPAKFDRPAIDKITAWRRGLVDFDDLPLRDAVAEMNRYDLIKLTIARPEAAEIRVTGVFRAGDAQSFAAAVKRAYGLQVQEVRDEIRLDGAPSKAFSKDN